MIEPADVQLAVGPQDVVEMVNLSVEIWTKTGTEETSESLGTYFTDNSHDRREDSLSDPRVVYDPQSQRWFATILDLTSNSVIMVVSPTPLPGSGSWVYSFPSGGCQDQPRLGVSDTLVAYGANLFSACPGGSLEGGQLTVIEKSDLVNGLSVHDNIYGPSIFFRSLTPVVSLSSTSTLYFVATDVLFSAVDLFSTASVDLPSLSVTRVRINAVTDAPAALQSDPALIATGDDRVQNAVWENGNLWASLGTGCNVTGEIAFHACGRFVEINTATDTAEVDATLALASDRDLFYPVVMPASDGNIYAAFGYSSASETPGVGMIANPQTPGNWDILTQGTGANESGRWGDYFGIARDPSDPTHVWVAATYGTGGGGWATTVAALGPTPFAITPPPAPAPTPAPTPSPSPNGSKTPTTKAHPKKAVPKCAKGKKSTAKHPCRG